MTAVDDAQLTAENKKLAEERDGWRDAAKTAALTLADVLEEKATLGWAVTNAHAEVAFLRGQLKHLRDRRDTLLTQLGQSREQLREVAVRHAAFRVALQHLVSFEVTPIGGESLRVVDQADVARALAADLEPSRGAPS